MTRYHYSSCCHGYDLTIDVDQRLIDVVDQSDPYHPPLVVDAHDAHHVLVRGGKWEGTVLLDDDDYVVVVDVDHHRNYDCTDCVPEVESVPIHDHLYHYVPPVAGGRMDVDHAHDDPMMMMMDDDFVGRTNHHLIGDDHEDGDHGHLTIWDLSFPLPDDDFLFCHPYQFQQYR